MCLLLLPFFGVNAQGSQMPNITIGVPIALTGTSGSCHSMGGVCCAGVHSNTRVKVVGTRAHLKLFDGISFICLLFAHALTAHTSSLTQFTTGRYAAESKQMKNAFEMWANKVNSAGTRTHSLPHPPLQTLLAQHPISP